MSERCVKIGCPEYLRIALQDPCTGEPIPGAANGAILRCTRNNTLEAVNRDPEISEFVSDCNYVDRYVQDGQRQGFNLTFEVSSVSPELEGLLSGDALLTDGTTNIGVIYEALAACSSSTPDPRFITESFFKVRECDAGGSASYIRYTTVGMRFQPVEMDREGQIGIVRYTGTSDQTLASGLVSVNNGPFNDLPAAVVADLTALGTKSIHGFWFVDDTDPAAGAALAANTCYMTAIPAAAP